MVGILRNREAMDVHDFLLLSARQLHSKGVGFEVEHSNKQGTNNRTNDMGGART